MAAYYCSQAPSGVHSRDQPREEADRNSVQDFDVERHWLPLCSLFQPRHHDSPVRTVESSVLYSWLTSVASTSYRHLYEMVMSLVKKIFNKEDVVEEVKMEETTPQPEAEKMDEEGKAPAAANEANATAPQKEEEGKGRGGFPFALSFGSGYSGTSNYQVPVDDQLLGALPKVRIEPRTHSKDGHLDAYGACSRFA